jgi:predicted nucleic acid-binding protein
VTAGLDTSVVVRLLTGEPAAQARRAREQLEASAKSGAGPLLVSDLVVGEAYFALLHHYAVPQAEAVAALLALLSDSRVRNGGVAREVLAEVRGGSARPGFMDRLIARDYAQQGAGMFTFDRDASRLPGVRLLG